MIFRQIIHDDLGCASYLIGDEHAGVAAVVDPRLEIAEYLELARYFGVRIEHILETHNHADHVSGHGRLAAATGATIHVHADAAPDYEHDALADGDEIELGGIVIRALHTPGHRPEHTAYLLIDRERSDEPWAVLTGDSLFVNDVARPDLAIERSEGARQIHESLQSKLLSLPDDCEVWPAHLGGSMCGGPGLDMKVSSTIGYERRHNRLLGIEAEDEFVEASLANIGPQPPNFERIVAINRGPLETRGLELLPLTPRQVSERRRAGAMLVDVRTDQQFDEAHLAGSISIPMMRAGFGSKLAWLSDPEQEIVLIGRDANDGMNAARLGLAVGVRNFAGYLDGGMTSWRQEGEEVERIERLPIAELAKRQEADGVQIVDARAKAEYAEEHISGSVNVPWHDAGTWPGELDRAKPTAVLCGSGQRAGVAASLLQREGGEQVIHVVDGGVRRWREQGNPVEGSA